MPTHYLRGWVLQGLAETIADQGGDVDAYAARFQLPLRPGGDPDLMLPGQRMVRLLEACAEDLRCPDFGLRAGLAQGRDALGPVALMALHCATAGEAIEAIVRYFNLLTSAVELQLQTGPDGPRVLYQLNMLRAGPTRQFAEWTLAVGWRTLKVIASDQARPRALLLPHAPLLPLRHYAQFFDCPVRFSQAQYGIEFFAADLLRPMLRNDPELKRLISDYIENMPGAGAEADTLRGQLELMVRKLLPTGRCNLQEVAGHFHVSASTLQRRLRREGLAFEEVVDGVRREGALRLLPDPSVRLSQVAGLLGYTAQSSFNHAFQRWYGVSPGTWRGRSGGD